MMVVMMVGSLGMLVVVVEIVCACIPGLRFQCQDSFISYLGIFDIMHITIM